jgi:phosphoglycerol transferase MdoB-like AlkP superfamily enzyme
MGFLKAWSVLLRSAVLLLVVFSLSRLALIGFYWSRVDATDGLGYILMQGLRFDLVLIGLLLGPWLVLMPWFSRFRIFHRLVRFWVLLIIPVALFVELSTLPFIEQYDVRPNYLFVEYLAYPKEVLSTLLGEFAMELFLTVALAIAGGIAAWRLSRPRPHQLQRIPLLLIPVISFVFLLMTVAMVRSTLDHRPVNPSTVAFSADAMVNQLPLNSPYTLLYAIYEERRDEAGSQIRYGVISDDEAIETVLADAELENHLSTDGSPSMHYQAATRHFERPLNIVIILQESLGAEFVKSLGGFDLTPNIDRLAADGIWFEQLYATGTRSVRGIEAIITGFTPTPRRSVVKLAETQNHFFTLASLLSSQGYHTSFIYGGEAHFDNMARFFLNNGFQEVIDERDYEDPIYYGTWGVSDEDLFARAHQEFLARGDQPFFSLVFTSSNHSPFDLPPGRVTPEDGPDGPLHTAIKYADYAVGEFFDQARQAPYWDNTIFLLIADHNSRTYGDALVPIERFHIPGLILGGRIEPRAVPGISSQIDMLPTLLSLAGVDGEHPAIGRDLTSAEFARGAGRAIMQFNAIEAYMEPGRVVVMQPDMAPESFLYGADKVLVPDPDPDPDLKSKALAYAAWGVLETKNGYYFDKHDQSRP